MPRPRREDARDRLLEAGLSLFAQRGPDRVHSNAIARRAGVGIGTFYACFEDKHALLAAIERRTLDALRGERIAALAEAGDDPLDQVHESVSAAVDFASRHPEAYRLCFGRERVAAKPRRPVLSESSRPTAGALRRLQREGWLDPELDVELAARAWVAMETGLLLGWLEDPRPVPADAIIATLCRLHPARAARIA